MFLESRSQLVCFRLFDWGCLSSASSFFTWIAPFDSLQTFLQCCCTLFNLFLLIRFLLQWIYWEPWLYDLIHISSAKVSSISFCKIPAVLSSKGWLSSVNLQQQFLLETDFRFLVSIASPLFQKLPSEQTPLLGCLLFFFFCQKAVK